MRELKARNYALNKDSNYNTYRLRVNLFYNRYYYLFKPCR